MILLAAAFLVAGLAGLAAFWVTWPRTSNTSLSRRCSPWCGAARTFATALLTWHRSRLAAPAFLAAIALLVFPLSFVFPGGQLFLLPSLVVIVLVAFLGYRYLRRACQPAA